jgi:hypothetical protein
MRATSARPATTADAARQTRTFGPATAPGILLSAKASLASLACRAQVTAQAATSCWTRQHAFGGAASFGGAATKEIRAALLGLFLFCDGDESL